MYSIPSKRCKGNARNALYNEGNQKGDAIMVACARIRFAVLPVLLAVFALAGCGGAAVAPTSAIGPTAAPIAAKANLAPDFAIPSPERWYNSPPLTLAGLRGKPVLLVFWSDI